MLAIGKKGREELIVSRESSAMALGSGTLEVFATPAMIALMEKTARKSVQGDLEEGFGTVGISVNIKHVAATPLDMKVVCESELLEIDGKKLVFSVKAFDESGLIGEGVHERFIISNDKFQQKTDAKKVEKSNKK